MIEIEWKGERENVSKRKRNGERQTKNSLCIPKNKNLLRYNCVVFNMFHCGEKMIPSHGVCLNIERKKG